MDGGVLQTEQFNQFQQGKVGSSLEERMPDAEKELEFKENDGKGEGAECANI